MHTHWTLQSIAATNKLKKKKKIKAKERKKSKRPNERIIVVVVIIIVHHHFAFSAPFGCVAFLAVAHSMKSADETNKKSYVQ